jgi:fatty acid desaturase
VAAGHYLHTHAGWAWLLVVPLIGARQHALAVLAHDASHFRLLPGPRTNDTTGNVLLAWPVFISVEGFRHFHGLHHRFLAGERDGNRPLWRTHAADGGLVPEWRFPKTPAGLARVVLARAAFLTGLWWIVRGSIFGLFFGVSRGKAAIRLAFYLLAAALVIHIGLWPTVLRFWLVPFCTWHIGIQYVRLICEHSAVRSGSRSYAQTRTTIPGWLGRTFVLPRNVGFHLEHHWYPSVPFYRLPELHARLLQEKGFREGAVVHHSLAASLRECTQGMA